MGGNGEYYKYDALASTTKIEDITSDENNAAILQRLKDNDRNNQFGIRCFLSDSRDDKNDFLPECTDDFGWFGYFIGKNTSLNKLSFYNTGNFKCNDISLFCKGLGRNQSIEQVCFLGNLARGGIFTQLSAFFGSKLVEIELEHCTLGPGCARNLSVALGGCQNKSLKRFLFERNDMGSEHVTDIILALSMHPQLEELHLESSNIGRDECIALSTLLSWSTTAMRTLELGNNSIDSEGVQILSQALERNKALHSLDLSRNQIGDAGVDALIFALTRSDNTIRILNLSQNDMLTSNGIGSLASFLESANCKLEDLYLCRCNTGGEREPMKTDVFALMFAKALGNNCKLKTLGLNDNGTTKEGWAHFVQVLCNTSTVNKTFLSNHCLESLEYNCEGMTIFRLPTDVQSSLTSNSSFQAKSQVAMKKILQHHYSFNMEPFFEWDFKMLPHAITWFDTAASLTKILPTTIFGKAASLTDRNVRRLKLSSIYDFIRGLAQLYIEICTRKQLEEIRAKKMKLRWEQLQLSARLEEMEQQEVRAMGRL